MVVLGDLNVYRGEDEELCEDLKLCEMSKDNAMLVVVPETVQSFETPFDVVEFQAAVNAQ